MGDDDLAARVTALEGWRGDVDVAIDDLWRATTMPGGHTVSVHVADIERQLSALTPVVGQIARLEARLTALEAEYAGPNWKATILAHDARLTDLEDRPEPARPAPCADWSCACGWRGSRPADGPPWSCPDCGSRVYAPPVPAGRPVVVVPSGVHDVDAYYRDDEPADVTAGIVLPQGGSVVSPPAPARPAPLPDAVAQAVGLMVTRADYLDSIHESDGAVWRKYAQRVAAWATAQLERASAYGPLYDAASDGGGA